MQRTIRQQHINVMMALVVSAGAWSSGVTGRWILAFVVLLIVPGWWWQRLWPLDRVNVVGRIMMQTAIGPTFVMIAYVWAAWLGIQLPVQWMWLVLVVDCGKSK